MEKLLPLWNLFWKWTFYEVKNHSVFRLHCWWPIDSFPKFEILEFKVGYYWRLLLCSASPLLVLSYTSLFLVAYYKFHLSVDEFTLLKFVTLLKKQLLKLFELILQTITLSLCHYNGVIWWVKHCRSRSARGFQSVLRSIEYNNCNINFRELPIVLRVSKVSLLCFDSCFSFFRRVFS